MKHYITYCLLFLSSITCSAEIVSNYGTWESPITAEKFAEKSISISHLWVDNDFTYFCEARPQNLGRSTIVRRSKDGSKEDMTPLYFDVSTAVHEYGGGAFLVSNGTIYASNGEDHAIYVFKPNKTFYRLTEKGMRFADFILTPYGLVAVGEKHESGKPVQNFIALIDTETGSWKILAAGYDFYSSPALSPDGKKLAWICWNHPNMPWLNTELWTGEFNDFGELTQLKQIGGDRDESFFQPQWSPEGVLYFVTDRDGWWNIHRFDNDQIENIYPIEAEIAEPLWSLGLSSYAFLGQDILFAYNQEGAWNLALLNPQTKECHKIKRNSSLISQLRRGSNSVQFLEQYPDKGESLLQIDSQETITLLDSTNHSIDHAYISIPQHIHFPSGDRIVYGFYYRPRNPYYKAPKNEKPPLIVMVHGGPTWQASSSFQLEKQFWTSRGFAVLDVNYGGSSGYGREYRNQLHLNWGVVDVEDCVNGALYLAQQGLVDRDRMAIRGGSSGGYTTLAALAFRDIFKAGASYYGIADLTLLDQETHKFEQGYMEHLVGKYSENKSLWHARSPIHAIDNMRTPLILFQGDQDVIVPKNQSKMIYDALKKKGIDIDLHIYPGEGHGFRQSKNLMHALDCEAKFYMKTFNII